MHTLAHTDICACKKKQRLTLKNVKENQELVSGFANNLEQQRTWAKGKKNCLKLKVQNKHIINYHFYLNTLVFFSKVHPT